MVDIKCLHKDARSQLEDDFNVPRPHRSLPCTHTHTADCKVQRRGPAALQPGGRRRRGSPISAPPENMRYCTRAHAGLLVL